MTVYYIVFLWQCIALLSVFHEDFLFRHAWYLLSGTTPVSVDLDSKPAIGIKKTPVGPKFTISAVNIQLVHFELAG